MKYEFNSCERVPLSCFAFGHQTPQSEEVQEFHNTDKTETHAEAKNAANVANDIFNPVLLISHELHHRAFLEENFQQDIPFPAKQK